MRGKKDLLYLHHIMESLTLISQYLSNVDIATFKESQQLQDAVVRRFEVVGEAAKRVSPELRNQYPNIPWRHMVGMRDNLIHDYEMVDYELVWSTYRKDVPSAIEVIQQVIVELTAPHS